MLHGFLPSLIEGAWLTLSLALSSLAVAMALGLGACFAKMSRARALRWPAQWYTTVVRGIPDLVLVLLVFYGGQVVVNDLALRLGHEDYIDVDPFVAGVLTIGFIFGVQCLLKCFKKLFIFICIFCLFLNDFRNIFKVDFFFIHTCFFCYFINYSTTSYSLDLNRLHTNLS